MRWAGMMSFDWIIDTSRQVRGSQGYNETPEEFMDGKMEMIPYWYTLDLLADHEHSIQVWLEKEALAGVVWPNCAKWDVPLFCARGYASDSFLYEAAKDLERKDRPAHIFYFGDYDPEWKGCNCNSSGQSASPSNKDRETWNNGANRGPDPRRHCGL